MSVSELLLALRNTNPEAKIFFRTVNAENEEAVNYIDKTQAEDDEEPSVILSMDII